MAPKEYIVVFALKMGLPRNHCSQIAFRTGQYPVTEMVANSWTGRRRVSHGKKQTSPLPTEA